MVSRAMSSGNLELAPLAVQLVDEHELAVVAGGELLVGVQQFDAADRAGRVDVDEEIGGEADSLDVALALAEADVGDVGLGIVGELHRRLRNTSR